MKNINFTLLGKSYGNFASILTSLLLSIFTLLLTEGSNAQTICNNQTVDKGGGIKYEYWKSYGDGCMTIRPDGGFDIDFRNVGNLLARKAIRPGSFEQVVDYDVDYRPVPNTGNGSFVCVYGWTKNPLIEYYIVEAWSDGPKGKGTRLGTITSDGSTYDLYRTERVNKPSIEGTKTFYQYWSIRRDERTKGKVTTANHFQGWRDAGLNLGTLWEVSLLIESLKEAKGTADVKYANFSIGTGNNTIAKGPEGYKLVSNEAETVEISNIPLDIAYGQDGDYVYLSKQTSNVTCSNAAFGSDPKPGVKKYCFVKESKAPYLGNPVSIPGIIEAENFDHGGQGTSYFDNDESNKGEAESNFRTSNGVDIGTGNGSNVIGWTADNEWFEHTVTVSEAGEYKMDVFYSSKNGGGELGIDLDGSMLTSGIVIPTTGDWDVYSDLSEMVNLPAGEHVLRFKIEKGGFNLDKVEFSRSSITSTAGFSKNSQTLVYPNPSSQGVFNLSSSTNWGVYRLNGSLVKSGQGNLIDLSTQDKSIYLLKVEGSVFKLISQ